VLDHQRSDTDAASRFPPHPHRRIVRRIESAPAKAASSGWCSRSQTTPTTSSIVLIVAPHYRIVSSGLLWPDLGLSRIATITPSTGDRPDRQESAHRRHLPHHARSRRRHHLCRRAADRQAAAALSVGARRLQGQGQLVHVVPGHRDRHFRIAGVGADHPVRGQGQHHVSRRRRIGVAVLVYIGVDFGFWGKVLDMSNNAERIWRAAGEAILAATLLVFLFAYLNSEPLACALFPYHGRLGGLSRLAGGAGVVRSRVASGIARMSLVLIAFAGFALIVYLSPTVSTARCC